MRQTVAQAVGLKAGYLDPLAVLERYDELMQVKADKTPAVPVQLLGANQREQMAFGF